MLTAAVTLILLARPRRLQGVNLQPEELFSLPRIVRLPNDKVDLAIAVSLPNRPATMSISKVTGHLEAVGIQGDEQTLFEGDQRITKTTSRGYSVEEGDEPFADTLKLVTVGIPSGTAIPVGNVNATITTTTTESKASVQDINPELLPSAQPQSVPLETKLWVEPPIPADPSWAIGDTHVHTRWSDGIFDIQKRFEEAKRSGYDWLAITDHTQFLDRRSNGKQLAHYADYLSAIDSAAKACGGPVPVRALEYSTSVPIPGSSISDAHYLVYGKLDPYVFDPDKDPGNGDYFVHKFDSYRNVVCAIAHPMSLTYPWFHTTPVKGWDTVDFSSKSHGIELMSETEILDGIRLEERTLIHGGWKEFLSRKECTWSDVLERILNSPSHQQTIKEWDALLRSGDHVYASAGSDAHAGLNLFGGFWTYVKIPSKLKLDESQIISSLSNGSTIASTGPFAVFSVNGHPISDEVVPLSPRNPIAINVRGQSNAEPIFFRLYYNGLSGSKKADVILNSGDLAISKVHRPNGSWAFSGQASIRATSLQSGYLRLEVRAADHSRCYTSPIYVRVN